MTPEQAKIRRARAITRELDAITGYVEKIAAERRGLVRQLIRDHGVSQHQIALQLEISQPAVHKIMEKEVDHGSESP